METLQALIRYGHVAFGFVGLGAFWIPVLTRKGGHAHRLFGRIHKNCAWVVLGSAGLAVFGINRLFELGLTGWVAVIPWVTPAALGIPATIIWTRHYQKKFGELA